MSIHDNFGIFGGSSSPEQPRPPNPQNFLVYAIQEVTLCTPDSIQLAIQALARHDIVIPELAELASLEKGGKIRDETFAQQKNELKQKILKILKDLLG